MSRRKKEKLHNRKAKRKEKLCRSIFVYRCINYTYRGDSLKEKVLKWIEENFESTSITIIDFPIFPGGCLIKDSQGEEMLVYYDITTENIEYEYSKNNPLTR